MNKTLNLGTSSKPIVIAYVRYTSNKGHSFTLYKYSICAKSYLIKHLGESSLIANVETYQKYGTIFVGKWSNLIVGHGSGSVPYRQTKSYAINGSTHFVFVETSWHIVLWMYVYIMCEKKDTN